MRSRHLFLLIYLLAICRETLSIERNGTCIASDTCAQVYDPTSHFLHCVGLPSTDTGKDHMMRLKGIIDAALDMYTFMRSSVAGVPILSLEGEIELNPGAEAFQDQALVQMWLQVKIKPLLNSISKHFLTCLSTKNFSCETYQTVVKELSHHFSEMDPTRQKWIYTFFMYPFLAREGLYGCVHPGQNSEEWLMKNFGSFKALARVEDFSALNMVFSGLEVLHLLSPEQKAELLLRPEVAGLDNGTLSLVFHSLMTGGPGPTPTPTSTPGYTYTSHNPYSPPSPPQNSFREVVNGLMGAFRPVGSLVSEFVSLTRERNVSEIRSMTLTQTLLNWTLAELAGMYTPHNTSIAPSMEEFDVTNVEDWFNHVVTPLLRRFLPNGQLPDQIKYAFHQVFYLDMGNDTTEVQDTCSITLEERSCGLTNAVENVARFMHCAARSNLTMSEAVILRMITELTGRLTLLVNEFATANFSELASHFREVFAQVESPSLTQENLEDPHFIRMWFQIKLLPLLPTVPISLLDCLSFKNFTCPVYQALVKELSHHMRLMDPDHNHSPVMYEHFIHSFLLHHNTSDPQCVSSSSHSAEWLEENFGFFSMFAPITDFYDLNRDFSGMEVLHLLTPKQTAEMLLVPLPTPPEKDVIIHAVFDYLTQSQGDFPEFLHHLVLLAREVMPPCDVYQVIVERLYEAIPYVLPEIEPAVWASIDDLRHSAPEGCLTANFTCPVTHFNGSMICSGVDINELQHYLDTSGPMELPCNFTLEQYACAELKNFTANQLVSLLQCHLPGMSRASKVTWKMLLNKLSFVLDPALDIIANKSLTFTGPSASVVLDVIGEMRVSILTDEQLRDSEVIKTWFSGRLRGFLSSASGMFLYCLSNRNLSCHTFQQILQEFSHQFDNMTSQQQHLVLNELILPFLSKPQSDQGCVSSTQRASSSVYWLQKNFGRFSVLVSVSKILNLNPSFSPLEAVKLLSPKQRAEIVVLPLLAEKDVVINTVFDSLTASPTELAEFLSHLVMFSVKGNISCSSFQIIFTRLDQAMPTLPSGVTSLISYNKLALLQQVPPGCITYSGACNITQANETDICVGVNSTALQLLLNSGQMNGRFCDYGIEEYACASVSMLTAQDLAAVIKCNQSPSSTGSRPVWKLFLSKASGVLDAALDLLANTSMTMTGPSASVVLDVIGEMRVSMLTDEQLRDSDVIRTWFSGRLRGFLSSASGGFLKCLSSRNLSCHTYQQILQEFSHQFDNMTSQQQHLVLKELILPILSRPQSDQGCVSNNSVDWLQNNFGPFSVLVSVRDFLHLNPGFSPLEAVRLLSPKQSAELVVLPLPEKDVVINAVFDYLTFESPKEGGLAEFVSHLVMFAAEGNISCSSFSIIFTRLDQALPTLPQSVASSITNNKLALQQQVPPGCTIYSGKCNVTQVNEKDICIGVNSTALQLLLNNGQMSGRFCDFGIEEYACASVSMLTAQDLAAVMKCNQSPNSTGSRPVWKLFLSKASGVLDAALDLLANMSMTMTGPSASAVLDVIGEMRVSILTDEELRDPNVIRKWFSGRLRGFLSSASGGFLYCLSSRNLSCHTYQQILQEFSHQFDNMTSQQQHLVLMELILPFLSQPQSDRGCVSNSSVYWLQNNFGPFSVLVSVREFLNLNPGFSPVEAVRLLSPKQSAELVVLPLAEKDVVINAVFDSLTESPMDGGLAEFVSHLVMFSEMGNISCSSFNIIFTRLDQAMPTLPLSVASSITYNKLALFHHIPPGCIIYSGKCPVTRANETDICIGVNSTALQLLLNSGQMSGNFCDYGIKEYACASVSMLAAQDLAAVMKCNQSPSSTSSIPVWKLFLSKASGVLDAALDLLANTSMTMTGPSASAVLDVIGELRVSILTDEQLRDSDVIGKWFSGRLRGFLSSASGEFLYCLSSRNLSCNTYQQVLQEFSHQFDNMTSHQQQVVLTELIIPFLSRPQSDQGCVSNSSVYWLENNFGPFSGLVSVSEFLSLNPGFSPLEAVRLLSPKQSAELVVLPLPAEQDVVINTVFDSLTASPTGGLAEFVSHLVMFSGMGNISCSSYQIIFTRLDQALPTLPPSVASSIAYNKLTLLHHVPPGCTIYSGECNIIPANETDICLGVNSTALHLLNSGQMSGRFCDYGIKEYACASVSMLTAQDLAVVMKCNQSPSSTGSRPVWTLLLSKSFGVLDAALDILANMSTTMTGPSASVVLDVIGDVRLSMLTDEQLRDSDVIRTWFSGRLRGFLSSASGRFLQCLSSRNLSCHTYQQILQEFSNQFDNMTSQQQHLVLMKLILPFLYQSGQGCVSNSSVHWLQNNFGPFSSLVSVREFLDLNAGFSPLEAVKLLSPKQSAELVVLPLAQKDVVINTVFDYLTASPNEKGLAEFVSHLVMFSGKENISCSSYKIIFTRLDQALPTLPLGVASSITYDKLALFQQVPPGCIIYSGECNFIPASEADICLGVNSTALQLFLNSGQMSGSFCDYGIEEYACASVSMLTAQDLAAVMKCNQSPSSTGSRPVWKLFLSKSFGVLDAALDLLANTSETMTGPSASVVLDVIGEMRLSMLTDEQLRDSDVIRKWFSGRLRGFLSSASGWFLQCLSSRNLSCQTYQQVLKEFSHQFDNMTSQQQHLVLKELILSFLSRPLSDRGCVSNSSVDWLQNNFGPFSVLVSVSEFLNLNPAFSPLEAVRLLSPKQRAELVVLPLAEKDVVINSVFDYLTASPEERGLAEFLSHLVMFSGTGNISCSSYKIVFTRLDQALLTLPQSVASSVTNNKLALLQQVPPGCTIYTGECNVTPTNETDICAGVNSTALQLLVNNGQMSGRFCDYGIEEYACASLSQLTAQDLAAVLKCYSTGSNSTGSKPVWKLFLSKASGVLDAALDLLANTTFNPSNPATSLILDSIGEIRLDTFSSDNFEKPAFIDLWFKQRLSPFLPAVSKDFLSCLTTKDLNCLSYQALVEVLGEHQSTMEPSRTVTVYLYFIKAFLTRNTTTDPSCSSQYPASGEWLQKNFGAFSAVASFRDLWMLYSNFSAMDILPQLTVTQLAEVSSTPGQLTSSSQVAMVMNHVPNKHLTAFFDDFSPAIMAHESSFPATVRSAMLQVVFDRANLSEPSVEDSSVQAWLHMRLRPLLVDLSPSHVGPYFNIVAGRSCATEQQAVTVLNGIISTLGDATQTEIHNHIIQSLQGSTPLRCYGDNYNHSFYGFLESSFMGFQFPNLTTFMSLMPSDRMPELLNSMPPSDLGSFLRRPGIVDDEGQLCQIYQNYIQTTVFLENERLPAVVRRPTLPCVWPLALNSSDRSQVNAWFDRSLTDYLVYLNKNLLTSTTTQGATCLSFQKLVSVLGTHNYSIADFAESDVYGVIKAYLVSGTVPKCYDANDPELNSTAWFAQYIGPFMPFLTLQDLNTFGSIQVIQVFTVNPLNIALLNHSVLDANFTAYYTELIYLQDPNFNPLLLPLLCRCLAPGASFSQLTPSQSMIVLYNLTTHCTDLDPEIAAALAGNSGDNLNADYITALGSQSVGLSSGQLAGARPEAIHASLGILSAVNSWNLGQAMAIIQALMTSGLFQINSASSLFTLGSLVVGLPASTINGISSSQLLTASQNPTFVTHMVTAPQVIKQTVVTQIISVNSNSANIIQNVPDDLAGEIPRGLLQGFTSSSVTVLNRKKWKQEQAVLFFDTVATGYESSPDNLTSYVLQGFTCTRVTTMTKVLIKKLVKTCRRKKRRKVVLKETQLTCMYNYIKGEADVTTLSDYPPDVLLYYDYSLVPQANCRAYFQELADADFSVFSSALSYKRTTLFKNARTCLGITTTTLTEDNISVLGNMCCKIGAAYITNSHSSILEKLKNCPNINANRAASMETLLFSGTTTYGDPATWNRDTLNNLGILPLYLSSTFYDKFDKKTKRQFLKAFLKVLKQNGVKRWKKRRMKKAIRQSIKNSRTKRSTTTECTVGQITQVTISDETFPFDYDDETQFNSCLSATTVKHNLAAILDKVDQEEYTSIVLTKLREAYVSESFIPEEKVQVLGPASRNATTDDITMWNITKIDTLCSLMDSSDGEWDSALAKTIISKYLTNEGNSLGSAELSCVKGPNLCSLDASVLQTISEDTLSNSGLLVVSSCTLEKKKVLFNIAEKAFSGLSRTTAISTTSYQNTEPFLGGASLSYVRSASASDVNMDLDTFVNLDPSVVQALTVSEVSGLLGSNLAELKSFENEAVVSSWVASQLQSELETLGVGLTGGKADPVTTAAPGAATTAAPGAATTAAPGAATAAPGAATTAAPGAATTAAPGAATTAAPGAATTAAPGAATTAAGTATTGSGGAHIRADARISLLVAFALIIFSRHILQ